MNIFYESARNLNFMKKHFLKIAGISDVVLSPARSHSGRGCKMLKKSSRKEEMEKTSVAFVVMSICEQNGN